MIHESDRENSGCAAMRYLSSLVIDEEATAEQKAQVTEHLATCHDCASHFAFLRSMGRALAVAPMERSSSALYERIAQATYARPTFMDRVRQVFFPLPTRLAMGSVFAVLIVGAVVVPRLLEVPAHDLNPHNPHTPATIAALPEKTPGNPNEHSTLPDPIVPDTALVAPPATVTTGEEGASKRIAQGSKQSHKSPEISKSATQTTVAAIMPKHQSAPQVAPNRVAKAATVVIHKEAVPDAPPMQLAHLNHTNPSSLLTTHRELPQPLSVESRATNVEPTRVDTTRDNDSLRNAVSVAHTEIRENHAIEPTPQPTPLRLADAHGSAPTKFAWDEDTVRPSGTRKLDINLRQAGFRDQAGSETAIIVSAPTSGR